MTQHQSNIHPVFDNLLNRNDKEALLGQRSKVFWLTGLSGSGKTTIANAFERELNQQGRITQLLDGDNIRTGINNNLGFSNEDRKENIRRIAEIAKLFIDCGIITVCCFVSPTIEIRQQARSIIGEDDFIEIFVNTPLAICEQRDPKGLYKKARSGKISNFTGINAPFENPKNPHLQIDTDGISIQGSLNKLIKYALPLLEY